MKTILFVCTGNTCRSPIAQALLSNFISKHGDDHQKQDLQILSAGTHTQDGLPAAHEAIQVMSEEMIDLGRHRTSSLTENLIRQADYILTMSVRQCNCLMERFPDKNSIFAIKQFAAGEPGDVIDPYGTGIEAYRKCLKELKQLMPGIVARIYNTGGS